MQQTMCDHTAATCVESTGGTTDGRFKERYECPCGAVGWVTGDASAPADEWDRYGAVFE